MKRIYDMTEAEVLELTDERILKLVDYECALDGVPMLPPAPGIEPSKESIKPTTTVYSIAGFFMRDSGHAARVIESLNSGQLYKEEYPSGDYNTKYLSPLMSGDYDSPKVESKAILTAEEWDTIKDTHQQYSSRKKEWDLINKTYQEAIKGRAATSDGVWKVVNDARSRAYEQERIRAEFDRYLELSENNTAIAMNFLLKAKPSIKYDYPELVQELCPGYGMPTAEAVED